MTDEDNWKTVGYMVIIQQAFQELGWNMTPVNMIKAEIEQLTGRALDLERQRDELREHVASMGQRMVHRELLDSAERESAEWEKRYSELLEAVGGTWPG